MITNARALMWLASFMLSALCVGLVSAPMRLVGGGKDVLPTTSLLLWWLINWFFFIVLWTRRHAIAVVVRGVAHGDLGKCGTVARIGRRDEPCLRLEPMHSSL